MEIKDEFGKIRSYHMFSSVLPAPFNKINVMTAYKNYVLDFHSHPFYHVNHLICGSVTVRIGDSSFVVGAGETMVLPPEIPHRLESAEGYSQIGMDIGLVKDERGLSEALRGLAGSHFTSVKGQEVFCTYDEMRELLDAPTLLHQLRAVHIAEGILLDALDTLHASDKRYPRFVSDFNAMTETLDPCGLTLADICRKLCISRTHLERMAKRAFGCGASEYCARLRYSKVCALLRTTDATLADIALQCGFCDSAHLSVFFKRRSGQTPGEYRAANTRKIPSANI